MFVGKLRFNFIYFLILVFNYYDIQCLQNDHSHENYESLLNSLINLNEERMKNINRMIRLNDNNFNGFLRTLLQDQPQDYTIVVVKDIDKHNSKEDKKQADELQQNLVIPDRALRFGDSSDSDSDFSIFPKDKEPKVYSVVYSDNDSIPIPRARKRCIFACKNAYRRVCRKFKYECSSRMRRYFKAECDDACEKRF